MVVREIYERYQVPPWLQLHQVRVAAVGKLLTGHVAHPHDARLVISTCLLHDIGAIVKFDFAHTARSVMGSLCPPDEIPRWERVQQEMRERYGTREHGASEAILTELGLESERDLLSAMGFRNMEAIIRDDVWEAIIAQYADMRVGPQGILALDGRFADARTRYDPRYVDSHIAPARTLERKLFAGASMMPGDITDEAIAPLMPELWDFRVA